MKVCGAGVCHLCKTLLSFQQFPANVQSSLNCIAMSPLFLVLPMISCCLTSCRETEKFRLKLFYIHDRSPRLGGIAVFETFVAHFIFELPILHFYIFTANSIFFIFLLPILYFHNFAANCIFYLYFCCQFYIFIFLLPILDLYICAANFICLYFCC